MKKVFIALLVSGFILINRAGAQSIQNGINDLYAEKDVSAKAVFEKLLAVNPNNIDATYWLGQTYIDMNDIPMAGKLYEKALQASANAPLLIVGLGHVELLENKTSDARQRFDAAITMTHTRKGDDPEILNAIGRANVDAKAGDLAYAIEKLQAAAQRDPKNADIYLNLGNAYRKAKPGEGGGDAYLNYKKAIEANPNFAIAYFRIAQLFETQQNWEVVLDNLNQTIAKDPTFAPAYYELYYYYLGKLDLSTADDYAKKYIANADPDVQNDYLSAQTLWAQKKYNEAINIAKSIVSKAGEQTLPRTYKLLAYSYLGIGDTLQAKNYIDQYFSKEKSEKIVTPDYLLKANIYAGVPGDSADVVKAFVDASNADTTIQGKISLLKRGADLFKARGDRQTESYFRELIFKLRKDPGKRDIFDWGLANYFAKNYVKSDSIFGIYANKYPDETYGWQWEAISRRAIDTSMEQGLAVQPYLKLFDIAAKDTAKYRREYMESAGYLAGYYNNVAKDVDKALYYLNKMLEMDPNNEAIKNNIDVLNKIKSKQPANKNNKTDSSGKSSGNKQ